MLKTILSISGKPGLYKLISQGKNMLIVESLVDKKRFPAYGNEKIISLGDIAMYTDTEEVPLKDVLLSMKKKENGAAVALDVKKASVKELQAYLAASSFRSGARSRAALDSALRSFAASSRPTAVRSSSTSSSRRASGWRRGFPSAPISEPQHPKKSNHGKDESFGSP